jgi:LAS superfamily LD-carboxypeptidase LdcB
MPRKSAKHASIDACKKRAVGAWLAIAGVLVILGGGAWAYSHLYSRVTVLSGRVAELKSELASTTAAHTQKSDMLAQNLSQTAEKLAGNINTAEQKAKQDIENVATKVGGVEQKLDQKVGEISGTVTTLEKLSKTDPELLQKYSKVFFLNEHYTPERVSDIPPKYLYREQNPEVIHAGIWPYLQRMLDAAGTGGIPLYVLSAYRSFDEQLHLKSAYTVTYGAGTANQFSADQGYSEHQLATAVDLTTSGLGGQLEGFEQKPAYQWMLNNAHKYGFTLSYPQGNSYYLFEPWHWRFVGIKLATYLHASNLHFYDLDQRKIDEYLVDLFD